MRSFSEINWYSFSKSLKEHIRNDILRKGKEYILQVDEEEFIEYIIEKNKLVPLKIGENLQIEEPVKQHEQRRDAFGDMYRAEVYVCKVVYPFSGDSDLFRCRPDTMTLISENIEVDSSRNTVTIGFSIHKKDAEEFNRRKEETYRRAFANVENINDCVKQYNESYPQTVRSTFKQIKDEFKEENDFFSAINVKKNSDTDSIFSVPTIKKSKIIEPEVKKGNTFSSEPTMSDEMYGDVVDCLYKFGKSMEKKPHLHKGKDEEQLRDNFLMTLETRYEGVTATGETFNNLGKTDIALKYAEDNSNLFIAECKIWHGASEFLKAISQLFDRYLTWRDSKVAVMLFVRTKGFTSVLDSIKQEISSHEYFVEYKGDNGESSFSYTFHLPQDTDKKVKLEVMAFHFYDK